MSGSRTAIDALALDPPASWPSVTKRLAQVLTWTCGVIPTRTKELNDALASEETPQRLLATAYRAARAAHEDQPAAVIATRHLEELGRVFAAEVYPEYACNPAALAKIAHALATAQADARALLGATDDPALAAIYRDVTFADSEANRVRAALRQEMREVEALGVEVNAKIADAGAQDLIDAWQERQLPLLEQIEALPCTPQNAKIKAEAVAHIYYGSELFDGAENTTDNRLASQIIRCLIGGDA